MHYIGILCYICIFQFLKFKWSSGFFPSFSIQNEWQNSKEEMPIFSHTLKEKNIKRKKKIAQIIRNIRLNGGYRILTKLLEIGTSIELEDCCCAIYVPDTQAAGTEGWIMIKPPKRVHQRPLSSSSSPSFSATLSAPAILLIAFLPIYV